MAWPVFARSFSGPRRVRRAAFLPPCQSGPHEVLGSHPGVALRTEVDEVEAFQFRVVLECTPDARVPVRLLRNSRAGLRSSPRAKFLTLDIERLEQTVN
jgi:hypothetical protein